MIKVLIADNHPVVSVGITKILESTTDIEVQGVVYSTSELLHALEKNNPDVILLELDLPKGNSIVALRQIKKEYPSVKVLIFSGNPENVYALSTLRAGASGYLSKSASTNALIDAIYKITNGGIYITQELAQQLALDNTATQQRKLFRKLSTREVEVLKLLVGGKRNKEVAKILGLNEKTISTYKARLMKKLNVTNFVDMLQKAKALDLFN